MQVCCVAHHGIMPAAAALAMAHVAAVGMVVSTGSVSTSTIAFCCNSSCLRFPHNAMCCASLCRAVLCCAVHVQAAAASTHWKALSRTCLASSTSCLSTREGEPGICTAHTGFSLLVSIICSGLCLCVLSAYLPTYTCAGHVHGHPSLRGSAAYGADYTPARAA